MTFAVELRDLKKSLPRPITLFWQRARGALCALRVRLVCLGLLAIAMGHPLDGGVAAHDSVLAALCEVLTAAVSATAGLLCDASSDLLALLGDPSSPLKVQRLGLCLPESAFPLDICPASRPFPAFSGDRALALAACALFLFGCGFGRRGRARQGAEH